MRRLLVLFILIPGLLSAQDFTLTLDKHEGKRRHKIHAGSPIHLGLSDGKEVQGVLEMTLHDYVLISGMQIRLDSVAYIVRPGFKAVSSKFRHSWITAPVIFVYEGLNNLINTKNRPLISPPTRYIAGGLIGLSLLDRITPPRKIYLGTTWKLRIIDLTLRP